jgi:ABC-type maltose transport system permease subunit
MATVFNLNHHPSYLHWHFLTMSVSNVVVILAMLVVFAAAIALPFPGHRPEGSDGSLD